MILNSTSDLFRLKNDFENLWLLQKGSPESEIVAFNKICHKNKAPFKNHEICQKLWKIGPRVLGVTFRGLPTETKF